MLPKTPVTHGRMYRWIVAGYQIWKIVSDLWIIFFILVASTMNVMCLWGRHGKIKLLELSIKGLRILGVINIRITSICNPQSVCNVLTASVHVLESSVPIKTLKMYTDIHGGWSETVRMLPEVYRHYQKPQGSIGIFPEVYTDNRDGGLQMVRTPQGQ